HFATYPGELQVSLTATARAFYTLRLGGQPTADDPRFFRERRRSDGTWRGDKWNTSWIYTTWHVLLALAPQEAGATAELARDIGAVFLRAQQPDGSWGSWGTGSIVETSYAVLALLELRGRALASEAMLAAIRRARLWLLARYADGGADRAGIRDEKLWLCKEPYGVPRID